MRLEIRMAGIYKRHVSSRSVVYFNRINYRGTGVAVSIPVSVVPTIPYRAYESLSREKERGTRAGARIV